MKKAVKWLLAVVLAVMVAMQFFKSAADQSACSAGGGLDGEQHSAGGDCGVAAPRLL